jgi:hypothetical protein
MNGALPEPGGARAAGLRQSRQFGVAGFHRRNSLRLLLFGEPTGGLKATVRAAAMTRAIFAGAETSC